MLVEPQVKYLIDKLEYDKKVGQLSQQSKINQLKIVQETGKLRDKQRKMMEQMASSGLLQYQSGNPDDPYNYPLIDVLAGKSR